MEDVFGILLGGGAWVALMAVLYLVVRSERSYLRATENNTCLKGKPHFWMHTAGKTFRVCPTCGKEQKKRIARIFGVNRQFDEWVDATDAGDFDRALAAEGGLPADQTFMTPEYVHPRWDSYPTFREGPYKLDRPEVIAGIDLGHEPSYAVIAKLDANGQVLEILRDKDALEAIISAEAR